MSCDNNRQKYWKHLAGVLGGGEKLVDELERCFQANKKPPQNPALAEAKTRILFAQMKAAGIKPPTHSNSGLPRRDAQAGYAAVYDLLEKKRELLASKNQEKLDKEKEDVGKAVSALIPRLLEHFKGIDPDVSTLPPPDYRAERTFSITGSHGRVPDEAACRSIAAQVARETGMKIDVIPDPVVKSVVIFFVRPEQDD